jgi:hypothetical protein
MTTKDKDGASINGFADGEEDEEEEDAEEG